MGENKIIGFDPVCHSCGRDLNLKLEILCKRCVTPYCSEECLKKEPICYLSSEEDIRNTLIEFGLPPGFHFSYNDCNYIPVCGPILTGNIPKILWEARKGKAIELLKELEKKEWI